MNAVIIPLTTAATTHAGTPDAIRDEMKMIRLVMLYLLFSLRDISSS